MKHVFFQFFVVAFIIFAVTSTSFSRPAKKLVLPTAKDSLKTLFANGNIQLSSIKSCKSMKTESTDKTVFDYLSAIIANQAAAKTKTSLEYSIKLIKGKNNSRLWQAELTFNNLDEESGDPWNPGFRFLMRTQNHQMIRGSFQCIGN